MFLLVGGAYMWVIFSRHFKAMYDQTYEFNGLIGRLVAPWCKRCWSLSTFMLIILVPHITVCKFRTQRRRDLENMFKYNAIVAYITCTSSAWHTGP
jgi:hypothetical protein